MVNINGNIVNSDEATINYDNRGTYYGDGIFETMRVLDGTPIFFEAHYFRLMAGMRILRMDIHDTFTPEFIETSIKELLVKNELDTNHARVRLTVWRNNGGFYTPLDNSVSYSISAGSLDHAFELSNKPRVADLFKDHYVQSGLLSTIKSSQKMVNILAGRFALENDFQEMFLLNEKKMITEGISGNLFIRTGDTVKTPPVLDGCLNGIMREQVIQQLKRMLNYIIVEETVTPFELQRADEIFTTNVIHGITSVTRYRKKEFTNTLATELLALFRIKIFS